MTPAVSSSRARPSREERKAQTRRELLDAAARVFARSGFHGASLEEIAEEAGYSKGAVYSNFADKEDLLFSLIEERVELRRTRCIEAGAREVLCGSKTEHGADELMGMLDESPEWMALFLEFWTCALRNPRLRSRIAGRWQTLKASIGELVDGNLELSVPVEHAVTAMFAIGQGVALERVADPKVPDDLLGQTLTAYLRSVGKPRTGSWEESDGAQGAS